MRRRRLDNSNDLRELMRDLKEELGPAVAKRCKAEIMDVAQTMANDIHDRAPIYTGTSKRVIKGALKASVKCKWDNGFAVISANVENPDDGARYGYILEYTEHPFFYPGVDAHLNEYKARVRQAASEAVNDIKRG